VTRAADDYTAIAARVRELRGESPPAPVSEVTKVRVQLSPKVIMALARRTAQQRPGWALT
jgi:hypothetical protein